MCQAAFLRKSSGNAISLRAKHTKIDKKFMKLRSDTYSGKTIDFSPHIKIGNKEPKLLRVHFFIDREQKMIVIGHCGGHLENFSLKNQS